MIPTWRFRPERNRFSAAAASSRFDRRKWIKPATCPLIPTISELGGSDSVGHGRLGRAALRASGPRAKIADLDAIVSVHQGHIGCDLDRPNGKWCDSLVKACTAKCGSAFVVKIVEGVSGVA